MPTDQTKILAQRNWGIELSNNGWDLEGIDLENKDMMTAIFEDREIRDDYKRQSQLRGYIKKQQENGELD